MLKVCPVTPKTFPSWEGKMRVALAPTHCHLQTAAIGSCIPESEVLWLRSEPDRRWCGLEWQWLCRSPAC